MQQICGNYCPPSAFTLRLAKFYLEVNRKREDKLEPIPLFDTTRDSDSFLFVMEIGGAGMIILILFLNVGERPPGSKEQFLLFGGAVVGNSEVLSNFFKILKMSSSWRVAFLKLQHTVEFIKLKLN